MRQVLPEETIGFVLDFFSKNNYKYRFYVREEPDRTNMFTVTALKSEVASKLAGDFSRLVKSDILGQYDNKLYWGSWDSDYTKLDYQLISSRE